MYSKQILENTMTLAKAVIPLAVLGALLGACSTTSAPGSAKFSQAALVSTAPVVGEGIPVQAPRGFVQMCARDPDLCAAPKADAPLKVVAQDDQIALLDAVNRRVNTKVWQRSDWSTFKANEVWSRPVARSGILSGDCEDIAIEKRQQLIAAGLDPSAMFYAVVYRPDIGLHVLLVVSTPQGDLALDSRSPWVQPWDKVPYTWVKRQRTDNPNLWAMVTTPQTHKIQIAQIDTIIPPAP
jgi:predicted transglutaminase-like cysteine proteinase